MNTNYTNIVELIINDPTVLRATRYVSPKEIVRAVRKSYKAYGRKPRKGQNVEITLTIGKPNYLERDFIKLCQKAKEPFPIKMIQLKHVSIKKNKLKGRKK